MGLRDGPRRHLIRVSPLTRQVGSRQPEVRVANRSCAQGSGSPQTDVPRATHRHHRGVMVIDRGKLVRKVKHLARAAGAVNLLIMLIAVIVQVSGHAG